MANLVSIIPKFMANLGTRRYYQSLFVKFWGGKFLFQVFCGDGILGLGNLFGSAGCDNFAAIAAAVNDDISKK